MFVGEGTDRHSNSVEVNLGVLTDGTRVVLVTAKYSGDECESEICLVFDSLAELTKVSDGFLDGQIHLTGDTPVGPRGGKR